jgi:hypothetical protein
MNCTSRHADRAPAHGPLLTFAFCCAGLGWRGKGTPGQAAALRLGGRRCAPTPLRCSVSRPRRRTHSATCGRCVRTASTSQKTKRAARAATSPALLGTSEARLRLPGRAFAEPAVAHPTRRTSGGLRGRRCPRGAISVATRSAAPGSARVSALRGLTCRGCSNAATAGRGVSSAARPWREHRSGVGAQRRPPQHEPPVGSACRDAPTKHESGHKRMSAKGRQQSPAQRTRFIRRRSGDARWSH